MGCSALHTSLVRSDTCSWMLGSGLHRMGQIRSAYWISILHHMLNPFYRACQRVQGLHGVLYSAWCGPWSCTPWPCARWFFWLCTSWSFPADGYIHKDSGRMVWKVHQVRRDTPFGSCAWKLSWSPIRIWLIICLYVQRSQRISLTMIKGGCIGWKNAWYSKVKRALRDGDWYLLWAMTGPYGVSWKYKSWIGCLSFIDYRFYDLCTFGFFWALLNCSRHATKTAAAISRTEPQRGWAKADQQKLLKILIGSKKRWTQRKTSKQPKSEVYTSMFCEGENP